MPGLGAVPPGIWGVLEEEVAVGGLLAREVDEAGVETSAAFIAAVTDTAGPEESASGRS